MVGADPSAPFAHFIAADFLDAHCGGEGEHFDRAT